MVRDGGKGSGTARGGPNSAGPQGGSQFPGGVRRKVPASGDLRREGAPFAVVVSVRAHPRAGRKRKKKIRKKKKRKKKTNPGVVLKRQPAEVSAFQTAAVFFCRVSSETIGRGGARRLKLS